MTIGLGFIQNRLTLNLLVAEAGPVDINTADAVTLAMEIKGVGESLAAAIVADREQNGPYASVEDLTRVRGIGDKTVESNRENLKVELREGANE